MKRNIGIFLAMICAMLIGAAAPASAQEVGHYQIFQGKYTHWDLDNNTSTEKEEIFLLDTTNGNVQVYVSSSKEGKETKYWAPALVDEANKTMVFTNSVSN